MKTRSTRRPTRNGIAVEAHSEVLTFRNVAVALCVFTGITSMGCPNETRQTDCPSAREQGQDARIPYLSYPSRPLPLGLFSFGIAATRLSPGQPMVLVLSSGQDKAPQPLVLVPPRDKAWPTWYSKEIEYHGRAAVGDLDADGYPEVAVAIFADRMRRYSGGKIAIYKNRAGKLETNASTEIATQSVLGVSFGDADGDGDLDLLAGVLGGGGRFPEDIPESGPVVIFENRDGKISGSRHWASEREGSNYMFDVLLADIDQDGLMDLAANGNRLRIYFGRRSASGATTELSTTPEWTSSESWQIGYDLGVGKVGPATSPAIVVTAYCDACDHGYPIRIYHPVRGDADSQTASWASSFEEQGGGIALHDLNNDGFQDLAATSQNVAPQPLRIYAGGPKGIGVDPDYCTAVGEMDEHGCPIAGFIGGTVTAADIDARRAETTERFPPNGLDSHHGGHVFTLQRNARAIQSVRVGGHELSASEYAFVPGENQVSIGMDVEPRDRVQVDYLFDPNPDLFIADMNPNCGPGVFYHYSR